MRRPYLAHRSREYSVKFTCLMQAMVLVPPRLWGAPFVHPLALLPRCTLLQLADHGTLPFQLSMTNGKMAAARKACLETEKNGARCIF